MASKKKKSAKRKSNANIRSHERKEKTEESAMKKSVKAEPITGTETQHNGPITPSAASVNAQAQSPLFKLPLEVRLMIYNYALSADSGSDPHTYVIGHRPLLPRYFYAQLTNKFKLVNIHHQQLSLLRTCNRVRREVQEHVIPLISFRFMSSDALASFLEEHGREHAVNKHTFKLLRNSPNIEVVINKTQSWFTFTLIWLGKTLTNPLPLTFVDEIDNDDSPSNELREAVECWDKSMQRFCRG